MAEVIIVEDKNSFGEMLKSNLEDAGINCRFVRRGREALAAFKKEKFDVALLDLKLPDIDGIDLLRELRKFESDTHFIIMTAFGSIEKAVDAMRHGADDFLTKPIDIDELIKTVNQLLDARRCRYENILLKDETASRKPFQIVGRSAALKSATDLLQKVAVTDTTVLILGESGTGKELFARACHNLSRRSSFPFVPINCAAIPRELLENELFGSEKGAFTGAAARKLGKFELAHRGTIFLDEIGDLDLDLQAKILRVLQERTFTRLGGTYLITVDVRVIAASNRDLPVLVKAKNFREDLYYRLSVFPITVPPLRERAEDISLLIVHILARLRAKRVVSDEAVEKLTRYQWPGNVRELENTIERAVIISKDTLRPEHILLPETGFEKSRRREAGTLKETSSQAQEIAEADLIRRVLEQTRGNKTAAARLLDVSYKTLLNRIQVYKEKDLL